MEERVKKQLIKKAKRKSKAIIVIKRTGIRPKLTIVITIKKIIQICKIKETDLATMEARLRSAHLGLDLVLRHLIETLRIQTI